MSMVASFSSLLYSYFLFSCLILSSRSWSSPLASSPTNKNTPKAKSRKRLVLESTATRPDDPQCGSGGPGDGSGGPGGGSGGAETGQLECDLWNKLE